MVESRLPLNPKCSADIKWLSRRASRENWQPFSPYRDALFKTWFVRKLTQLWGPSGHAISVRFTRRLIDRFRAQIEDRWQLCFLSANGFDAMVKNLICALFPTLNFIGVDL